MNWLMNGWRQICLGLDKGIYWIVEQMFQLIMDLANFDLFSYEVVKEFSTRIYVILGLIMTFKLIVSFVQMLINPDLMDDKEKGLGNILKRVIIALILIVIVPSVFTTAKKLQNYIIPIIPKVVLGSDADLISNDENSSKSLLSVGKTMAYYSFLPFFYYNEGCNDGTLAGTGDDTQALIYSVGDIKWGDSNPDDVNETCVNAKTADGYKYNYRWLVSTAVGIYLVYVLLTVAVKIAIRTIKFGICQIIAPIPISSYIDPKTSAKAFNNWLNTSVKVYLDLFVRLIVVFFVVYVMSILFDSVGGAIQRAIGDYDYWRGFLVILFLVVGLLLFARQAPKFISDMLGVGDGFGDIADMFRGQGWKAMAGMGATAAAAHRTALTNARSSLKSGETIGTALRRALGGYAGATRRGLSDVSEGRGLFQGKSFRDTYNDSFNSAHGVSVARINKAATKRAQKESNKADIAKASATYKDSITTAKNTRDSSMAQYSAYDGLSREETMEKMHQQKVEAAEAEMNASVEEYNQVKSQYDAIQAEYNEAMKTSNAIQSKLEEAQLRGDTDAERVLQRQYDASVRTASGLNKRLREFGGNLTTAETKMNGATQKYNDLSHDYLRRNDSVAQDARQKLTDARKASADYKNDNKDNLQRISEQEAVAKNQVRNINVALENARRSGNTADVEKYTQELELAKKTEVDLRQMRVQIEQKQAQLDLEVQNAQEKVSRVESRTDTEVIEDNYGDSYAQMQEDNKATEDTYQKAVQEAKTKKEQDTPSRYMPGVSAVADLALGRETTTSSMLNELISSTNSIKNEALGQAAKKALEFSTQLSAKVKAADDKIHDVSFAEILDAKRKFDAGADEYKTKDGFTISARDFDDQFETIQKAAQVEYISKVSARQLKAKDGKSVLDDPLIAKVKERFDNLLLVIAQRDPAAAADLRKIYAVDPGKAIKKAGDYAEVWAVEADKLAVMESAKRDVKDAERK